MMVPRFIGLLGLTLWLAACAPTQRSTPVQDPTPAPAEQIETEQQPQSQPESAPVNEPVPGQPVVVDAPEPEPAVVAQPDPVPPPAWWFPEVRDAGERAILAPGIADAPTLLEARAGALAVARARVDAAAANWPNARADEAVRNAASATLPDGTFRYWVILYAQPRR